LTILAIGGRMSPEVPMPAKTLNISLPKELRDLIVKEVAEGAYGSVSEFIREAVRGSLRLRDIERVERLALEGLDSPEVDANPAFLRELKARARKVDRGARRRMSPGELGRRFEEAARVRALIRRSTLEMRAAGDRILAERTHGPHRPDDHRPRGS
jgi:putative addiction module CopG family antidote